MSSASRVLVIGGGMAGVIAALSAKAQGAEVRVARRSLGATALSSGAIDVAADHVAPGGDLASQLISPLEGARTMARLRPNHPYGVLRERLERLEESLRFAGSELGDLLSGPLPQNALLPTPLGTVKPSAMGQRNVLGANVAELPGRVAVVELGVNPSWDAQLIARGLEQAARAIGRSLEVVVVRSGFFNQIEDALRTPYELGERLDAPEALERFAADLKRALPPGVEAVLVPPVLGRRSPDLAGRLGGFLGGIRCAEILSAAPSLPGLRLQEALDAALGRAGIELDELSVDGARAAEGVFLLSDGAEVRPDAVVLATGKYIGGGIARERRFRETVLNLPVFAGGRRVSDEFIGELLADAPASEQIAFRAGVRIDGSLRPLGVDGRPVHPRLHAAGSVLAGYDPATDKTGLGVAIFTGYLAGELAARGAGSEPVTVA